MLGTRHLQALNKALCDGRSGKANLPFGGITVIFLGDFYQYLPVLDRALYKECLVPADPLHQRPFEQESILGWTNWQKLTHVVRLRRTYRFVDDPAYGEFLERVRMGKITPADIDCLNARVAQLGAIPLEAARASAATHHLLHSDFPFITARNSVRVALCNAYLRSLARRNGQPVVVAVADDNLARKRPLTVGARKGLLSATTAGTDKQPDMLPLILDMEVMLKRNASVALGLCNGSRGYLRDIVFDGPPVVVPSEDGQVMFLETLPKCLIVEFPNCNLPKSLDCLPPNHVPIFPRKMDFQYGPKKQRVYRLQFPIVPCKALTGYNVQGQTLENGAVIDLTPTPRPCAPYVYVALSRVTAWKKLVLLRPVHKDHVNIPPLPDLLEFDRWCEYKARETAADFLKDHPVFASKYDRSWFPTTTSYHSLSIQMPTLTPKAAAKRPSSRNRSRKSL